MYPERLRHAAIAPLAFAAALEAAGCRKDKPPSDDAGASLGVTMVSAPSATSPGAPKPGMIWIPAGVLRAGTAIDEVPRVASEELPGVEIAMGGFYIDMLPFPNEAGAIPSANVTRAPTRAPCTSACLGFRRCARPRRA
jgi:formylglycine-generating enzyme